MAAERKLGYNFVYSAGIDVTTFSYDSYVQSMIDKGVQYVQYTGAYQNAVRLKQAIEAKRSSSFHPIFVMDPVAYDQGFVQSGGSAVNGTYIFIAAPLFAEANRNPELSTYLQWLQPDLGRHPVVLRHLRLGRGGPVRPAGRPARRQADPGVAAVGACGA